MKDKTKTSRSAFKNLFVHFLFLFIFFFSSLGVSKAEIIIEPQSFEITIRTNEDLRYTITLIDDSDLNRAIEYYMTTDRPEYVFVLTERTNTQESMPSFVVSGRFLSPNQTYRAKVILYYQDPTTNEVIEKSINLTIHSISEFESTNARIEISPSQIDYEFSLLAQETDSKTFSASLFCQNIDQNVIDQTVCLIHSDSDRIEVSTDHVNCFETFQVTVNIDQNVQESVYEDHVYVECPTLSTERAQLTIRYSVERRVVDRLVSDPQSLTTTIYSDEIFKHYYRFRIRNQNRENQNFKAVASSSANWLKILNPYIESDSDLIVEVDPSKLNYGNNEAMIEIVSNLNEEPLEISLTINYVKVNEFSFSPSQAVFYAYVDDNEEIVFEQSEVMIHVNRRLEDSDFFIKNDSPFIEIEKQDSAFTIRLKTDLLRSLEKKAQLFFDTIKIVDENEFEYEIPLWLDIRSDEDQAKFVPPNSYSEVEKNYSTYLINYHEGQIMNFSIYLDREKISNEFSKSFSECADSGFETISDSCSNYDLKVFVEVNYDRYLDRPYLYDQNKRFIRLDGSIDPNDFAYSNYLVEKVNFGSFVFYGLEGQALVNVYVGSDFSNKKLIKTLIVNFETIIDKNWQLIERVNSDSYVHSSVLRFRRPSEREISACRTLLNDSRLPIYVSDFKYDDVNSTLVCVYKSDPSKALFELEYVAANVHDRSKTFKLIYQAKEFDSNRIRGDFFLASRPQVKHQFELIRQDGLL